MMRPSYRDITHCGSGQALKATLKSHQTPEMAPLMHRGPQQAEGVAECPRHRGLAKARCCAREHSPVPAQLACLIKPSRKSCRHLAVCHAQRRALCNHPGIRELLACFMPPRESLRDRAVLDATHTFTNRRHRAPLLGSCAEPTIKHTSEKAV